MPNEEKNINNDIIAAEIEKMREMSVRKSNLFIQRARYSLSAQQFDIINFIISKVKPTDSVSELYTFTITEMCNVIGINPRQRYAEIKKDLDEIDKMRLWVPMGEKEVRIQWFHKLRMYEGSGTIEASFNEDLKPFLFNITKGYTQYPASRSYNLRSKYAKYLYDYLKSIAYKEQQTISLEYFNKYLCPNEYEAFKNIKQRILDAAIGEINEKTDLIVNYQPIKQNSRKTTHIFFSIQKKKEIEPAPAATITPATRKPQAKTVIEQQYQQRKYTAEFWEELEARDLEELLNS